MKTKLLLFSTIILAIILRFSFLSRLPTGFVPEEVSNGWNAYSILKTGRDEWGTWLPLVFKETGGYKLALNSYLIVPIMAVLGPSELTVRIPTALASVLAVWFTYVLAYQLFKKQKVALVASLLLAVSPWSISIGRYAEDVNWGITLFLLGVICFLKSFQNKRWLLVSAIAFGLTFYTYAAYIGFVLLFTWCILVWQRHHFLERQNWKWGILFLIIPLLFLLPYAKEQNVTTRFNQTTSTKNIGLINQINEHKTACLTVYPNILCHGLYNKITARIVELGKNYVNHYSTTTYFVYGSKLGMSGMPDNWGLLYLFEFPLIILGGITLIKKRQFSPVLIFWLLLFSIPSALVSEGHIWRMMTIVPVPSLLAAVGLLELFRLWPVIWVRVTALIVIPLFVFYFWSDYTTYFPYFQSSNSYYGFRDAYHFMAALEKDYGSIIVAPTGLGFKQLYIYYLFYLRPDPRAFQQGIDVERVVGNEGWVDVKRIGKWRFTGDVRDLTPEIKEKTLLLTDGTFDEKQLITNGGNSTIVILPKLLSTVYYPTGDVAFKIVELLPTSMNK